MISLDRPAPVDFLGLNDMGPGRCPREGGDCGGDQVYVPPRRHMQRRIASNADPSHYLTRSGNRFTTIVGTSSSSVSTNAASPPGPKATGIPGRPTARVPR